ncbi:ABC transporter permease [Candidatus Bathyarchaeota archaeon]|nr:ABC transporter permease [Candidatus Bathyarchaeota archaeon]
MTATRTSTGRPHPSWFTRFWAVVRYEMLWNIRKKKFLGLVIVAFIFATLSWVLPVVLSATTDQAINANPEYAVTFTIPGIGIFLFALITAMNSISSEFESGTIVPLLTKPVSRSMIFLGKLLATFMIILVTYTILFVYVVIGGAVVYGPQNNLHLVPLGLFGNILSTFVWIAIILAAGALSKSTIVSTLVALGVFIGLFLAVPIIAVFAGPSPVLNYLPGSGASGTMMTTQGPITVGAGTDGIGANLINYALYSSANVDFNTTNIELQDGQPLITQALAYSEPISVITSRSVATAVVYTIVFLFIAWIAFKWAQILE